MNRQEYKKAAELALGQAKGRALNSSSDADTNYVQNLIGIARVYAMLAAIPDEQDMRGEVNDRRQDETIPGDPRRPHGPGDVSGYMGR